MEGKAIWMSKTLWVNVIAILVLVAQTYTGFIISAESQVVLLGIINTILRAVTREPINWGTGSDHEPGFIRLSMLLPLAFLCALAFAVCIITGCATLKNDSPQGLATKSLLTMQQTVVAAARIGNGMCREGKLTETQCGKLAVYYTRAGAAYDLAADTLITAIKSGSTTDQLSRYQWAQAGFATVFGDVMSLSAEFGILPKLENQPKGAKPPEAIVSGGTQPGAAANTLGGGK